MSVSLSRDDPGAAMGPPFPQTLLVQSGSGTTYCLTSCSLQNRFCLFAYLFASLGCHIGDTVCKAVSKFSTHPCATILSNPSVCVAKTGVPSRQRQCVSRSLGLAVLCMEDLLSGLRPDSCESLT